MCSINEHETAVADKQRAEALEIQGRPRVIVSLQRVRTAKAELTSQLLQNAALAAETEERKRANAELQ